MMADIGIVPGAAVSALFFWLFLGPLFRIRRDGPPWIDGVGVGLAAFAIQNVADFTAYFPSLLWGAALLRGVVCEPSARRRREHESRRWAAALVLAVTLAAAILAVGVGLSANALYQARMAAARGQHGEAVDLARRAARLAPWSINAHSVAAQALMASGTSVEEWREALAYSQRAIDLSPVRASSRELRARARRRLGDNPGAYADLVEAARLYPLKTRYAEERDRLAASLPANLDPGQP
jgi:tetratricopeptide (TPR) repeat protein